MPDNPLTVVTDGVANLAKTIRDLANTSVMVGVPSDREQPHVAGAGAAGSEKRTNSVIGNAALAYIHENGSPINNIPARPFLGPGIEESRGKWEDYLQQSAKLTMEGNPEAATRALNAAGQTAVSAVKNKITEGIPPPLKSGTLRGRQRRHKGRQANTAADATPLIDTGQLLNSISYVLRREKAS